MSKIISGSLFIIIVISSFFAACKKAETVYLTVMRDTQLTTLPAGNARVPRGALKAGEMLMLLETKTVAKREYNKVRIDGDKTEGWLPADYVRTGKLIKMAVLRKSDLYLRASAGSPKQGKARAGEPVMKVSQKGNFAEVVYKGKTLFILAGNVGDPTNVERTVRIPGLGVAVISASSQYKSRRGKADAYDPRVLFDGKVSTAWCEGKDDSGIGESITLRFREYVTLHDVQIVNGFARSEKLYKHNNRVAGLRIQAENRSVNADFEDGVYDFQSAGGGGPDSLEMRGIIFTLTINKIHKGKVQDTCISELRIKGVQGGRSHGGPY